MSETQQVQRIAVIGAGLAGRAFALRCVQSGFAVTIEDVMPEKLRRAQDAYAELASAPQEGSLRFATEVEDAVRDADLAVDFVPDELESKLEIFCLLDRMAPPHTLLLTPLATLSLDDLASCTYRADRCVGVRGGLLGSGVTLLRGRATSSDAFLAVQQAMRRLGLEVTAVNEKADLSLAASGSTCR